MKIKIKTRLKKYLKILGKIMLQNKNDVVRSAVAKEDKLLLLHFS